MMSCMLRIILICVDISEVIGFPGGIPMAIIQFDRYMPNKLLFNLTVAYLIIQYLQKKRVNMFWGGVIF